MDSSLFATESHLSQLLERETLRERTTILKTIGTHHFQEEKASNSANESLQRPIQTSKLWRRFNRSVWGVLTCFYFSCFALIAQRQSRCAMVRRHRARGVLTACDARRREGGLRGCWTLEDLFSVPAPLGIKVRPKGGAEYQIPREKIGDKRLSAKQFILTLNGR